MHQDLVLSLVCRYGKTGSEIEFQSRGVMRIILDSLGKANSRQALCQQLEKDFSQLYKSP